LGLLIPDPQGEQQQGKQENAQGFQAKTVAVIHRLTCQFGAPTYGAECPAE
jgi:hypothetical protein